MAILREVEYDDFTGVTKRWYFDGDKIVCHKEYDESDFLDMTAIARNSTIDSSFINNPKSMHKMASLPTIVVEQIMKKHGLNLLGDLTPAEQRKLAMIIETEYPFCKTHVKKMWRPL